MVSNSLKLVQEEIIEALARLRREQADNPEYQKSAAGIASGLAGVTCGAGVGF